MGSKGLSDNTVVRLPITHLDSSLKWQTQQQERRTRQKENMCVFVGVCRQKRKEQTEQKTSSSTLSEHLLDLPFWVQILLSVRELLQMYVITNSNNSKTLIQTGIF